MILVLSIQSNEASTTDVIHWVRALGYDCIRFNYQDLMNFKWSLSLYEESSDSTLETIRGRRVSLKDIRCVWFRKMAGYKAPELDSLNEPLKQQIQSHLSSEAGAYRRSIHHAMPHAFWLSHPEQPDPNKFQLLLKAQEHGIRIPKTLITNVKADLVAFQKQVGEIITKPIGEVDILTHGNVFQSLYTEIMTSDMINDLPDQFFPVLVQEAVSKRYELRVFYLDGEFYSMAIMSQADEQTRVDFRVYNFNKPNRNVPYKLPDTLECQLHTLMQDIQEKTGSIDIIRGIDGHYYFLEVNPVGQFGMVSKPCNYHLEKRIADYLIKKESA